jgi:hypothetical protein
MTSDRKTHINGSEQERNPAQTQPSEGKAMSDNADLTTMNDPEFLAEYGRVRENLEALTERMRSLTNEFDRRAASKWAS